MIALYLEPNGYLTERKIRHVRNLHPYQRLLSSGRIQAKKVSKTFLSDIYVMTVFEEYTNNKGMRNNDFY